SYLLELDGKRIAFAGDLIYGDGKFIDLYSLQDAIPDVKEDGYQATRRAPPASSRGCARLPRGSPTWSCLPAGRPSAIRSMPSTWRSGASRRCSAATSPSMSCAGIAATT